MKENFRSWNPNMEFIPSLTTLHEIPKTFAQRRRSIEGITNNAARINDTEGIF